MKAMNAIGLMITAGCIAPLAHAEPPVQQASTLPSNTIGHIYYNHATGEMISTAISDSIRPVVGDPGTEVWLADSNIPCADFGQTAGTAVIGDDPNGQFGDPVSGKLFLDWGDVAADTVIDCLQVSWATFIPDTDTDSDSIGDGVEGFAATWSFFDGDNGFDTCFTRQGLIAFTFFGLAGSFDGTFAGYILTVDLAGTFSSSLAFEISDSDSDLNGAAVHNPLQNISDFDSDGNPDGDLDSDGLADFSYAIQYIQPGTVDFDNADGDSDTTTGVDGDPANQGVTAIALAAPFGTPVDNGDGTWSIILDPGVNATGAEDVWDEFDDTGYIGSFNVGGFSCDDGKGGANMFGQFGIIMYNGSGANPCPPDITLDGNLDVFDVFAFLDAFNNGGPVGDFNGDGIFDIFDVFAFLDAFNAGCP